MRPSLVLALALLFPLAAAPKDPDCTSRHGYAASMAFGYLKNAGLTDNIKTYFEGITVTRLASEKVGKNLYRQVHLVRFPQGSGETLEVITVNDASHEECSMSGVEVFVVSRHLGER